MFDLEKRKKPSKIKGLRHFLKFPILWKEDRYLKYDKSLRNAKLYIYIFLHIILYYIYKLNKTSSNFFIITSPETVVLPSWWYRCFIFS